MEIVWLAVAAQTPLPDDTQMWNAKDATWAQIRCVKKESRSSKDLNLM